MDKYLAVLAGGAIGSLLRFIGQTAIMSRYPMRFPLGTFVINVTGSFLIGVLMTFLTERFSAHQNWRLLLVTGFLGGYTTFSSFEWETYVAAHGGEAWLGFAYVASSVIAGYAAVWLGAAVARS